MFDTIILLAGAVEQAALASVLRGYNSQLLVHPVFTVADLAAIESEWLQRARLIAFATPTTVPPETLEQLGFGAYRFHPGSPQYPDAAPARLALQDGARHFGATAHRMTPRDDAGPIVDVEMFPVPQDIELHGLEELALGRVMQMFWRLAGPLSTQSQPLVQRAMRWGARREEAADAASAIHQTIRGRSMPVLRHIVSAPQRRRMALHAVPDATEAVEG
ncbi:methionyl-tRNA formyltransferase [Rhodopseudomonas sp. P2A-2r]|uniref:methionyl-tRNA formyltransferase n=1 Tax=unclassified Rhodopseudomonas TaxID=2638247 RepID=UPI0022340DA6|nr:methionyl-tRNA formyltransferase [Rhodopseudomonas sp. P2A-2r]UZE51678.1 methionyl-tRNA formyltransferase [Rhodopseudomonas sp. P2A-2r]